MMMRSGLRMWMQHIPWALLMYIYIYLLIDTEYLPIVMIYYWLFLLMPLCDFFERVIFHNVMSKIVCILFVPCSRKTHGRSRTWRPSTGSRRWCQTAMWPSANLPCAAPLPSSVSTCPSTLSEPRSVDTLCKLIGPCRGTDVECFACLPLLCCVNWLVSVEADI